MPAAAVIPAPIAYTKVVAVKKLVVESLDMSPGPFLAECVQGVHLHPRDRHAWHSLAVYVYLVIYCE